MKIQNCNKKLTGAAFLNFVMQRDYATVAAVKDMEGLLCSFVADAVVHGNYTANATIHDSNPRCFQIILSYQIDEKLMYVCMPKWMRTLLSTDEFSGKVNVRIQVGKGIEFASLGYPNYL